MVFIVACKDYSPNMDIKNASVEFAFRVAGKIWGKQMYSGKNTWVIKAPDYRGNQHKVHDFYTRWPAMIPDWNKIPSEDEAAEYFLNKLGPKEELGYGFLVYILEKYGMKYDMTERKTL